MLSTVHRGSFLVAILVLLIACAQAQRTTFEGDDGNTYIASIITDSAGIEIDVTTLSTILGESAVTTPTRAVVTTTTTTPAVVAPTTAAVTTSTTSTAPNQGVVQTPNSLCTTAGCPQTPTTYAYATVVGGVTQTIMGTWFATTPTTPIPTWASSGSIQAVSNYITTTATASSRLSGGAGRLMSPSGPGGLMWLDGGAGAAVVLVGALVGAVMVL